MQVENKTINNLTTIKVANLVIKTRRLVYDVERHTNVTQTFIFSRVVVEVRHRHALHLRRHARFDCCELLWSIKSTF